MTILGLDYGIFCGAHDSDHRPLHSDRKTIKKIHSKKTVVDSAQQQLYSPQILDAL